MLYVYVVSNGYCQEKRIGLVSRQTCFNAADTKKNKMSYNNFANCQVDYRDHRQANVDKLLSIACFIYSKIVIPNIQTVAFVQIHAQFIII